MPIPIMPIPRQPLPPAIIDPHNLKPPTDYTDRATDAHQSLNQLSSDANQQLFLLLPSEKKDLIKNCLPGLKLKVVNEAATRSCRLQRNTRTNFQKESGDTQLHKAVSEKNIDELRKLLANPHNPDDQYCENRAGQTPLVLAIKENNVEMITILLNNRNGVILNSEIIAIGNDSLKQAIKLGDTERAISLWKQNVGHNMHLTDSGGFTALHYTISSGNIPLVKWLLDNTCIYIDYMATRRTPLWLAVSQENPAIVQCLLDRNANLYPEEMGGKSILDAALKGGNDKIVYQLMTYLSQKLF